ncbi:hypothetical protein RHMOL_Rhmol05G0046200 [Rhododendron molle]|uniref:Uncharacterized protein n=1 Tax=Rhododendron molle TaxID=49168 RepID=A0ACC0NLZ0_RHOML|nr:hypothetical protein RHMOL_Rhmol05G0046200 [Rhododendron molle]
MYSKFCYSVGAVHGNQHFPDGLIRPSLRSSGIDKIVIESLPFFKFSALKGLRGGLECAVCLSKFEDIEVLRLLPKCKHAFHINCVDQWLENHSSCPLCRQRISVEDLTHTNSVRFLSSQSEGRMDSNVELFVQREDSRRHGSLRFAIGSSFRKFEKGDVKEDEFPIREDSDGIGENDNKSLHKFNHKIIMSNAVLKSRWSNLSSSDLLFLSSEMLGDVSSNRFSPLDSNKQGNPTTQATEEGGILKSKDEMGTKSQDDSYPLSSGANTSNPTRNLHPNEKRSMSEIVAHSRFDEFSRRTNTVRESSVPENAVQEERLKRLWLPIAQKTVQCPLLHTISPKNPFVSHLHPSGTKSRIPKTKTISNPQNFPMNQLILPLSLLLSVFCYVEAKLSTDQGDSPSQNTVGSFQPSIAAVLGILIIMFFLTIFLSVYTICCRGTGAARNNQRTPEVLQRPIPRSSGVDRVVIESLPFFKFSALRGLRGGLECAVCLSKFEDVEVLRLLPKCKHAFHINCVDQWLESHSSCPLCRQRISVEDLAGSNSSRVLSSQLEVRADSNVELFVQREDSRRHGSSRFSIGSSFRKFEKGVVKEDVLPIREACEGLEENDKFLHKFNHKIIMSGSVFKSRWSNLSSSDLLFLSSEMLGDASSNRFPLLDSKTQENSTIRGTKEGEIVKIKDGMGPKRDFETKVGELNQNDSYPLSSGANTSNPTRNLHPNEKRSMSEIVVHSRFKELDTRNNSVRESSVPENGAKEERLKRLWMPIARKTVQWYANRDKKYRQSNYTRQSLNA